MNTIVIITVMHMFFKFHYGSININALNNKKYVLKPFKFHYGSINIYIPVDKSFQESIL